MFENKKANYEKPGTLIGKDTVLETSLLKSKESIQINGIVKGDIQVEGSVVVGQNGQVTGNIYASFILVAGRIDGNCQIENQIHATKTAVIHGDIRCSSIVIDDGAQLNGKCDMKQDSLSKNNLQKTTSKENVKVSTNLKD